MKKEFSEKELEDILPTICELIMNEQLIIRANFDGHPSSITPTIKESSPAINGNVIQIDMVDQVANICDDHADGSRQITKLIKKGEKE